MYVDQTVEIWNVTDRKFNGSCAEDTVLVCMYVCTYVCDRQFNGLCAEKTVLVCTYVYMCMYVYMYVCVFVM
jgi:hypothetical protein